ncbi:alpha-2-glucosyltransferase Alg10 [Gilbertella persicaria]|uniref:alpha-2-glucosyltransferase Alg10 n=1 Tax=Gilbertella persicaria TaxID=101096 RepID=UPI0022204F8A|nr:alpha-2-glucosyltransferase Alg10 [Gilbertella persicaria]KAI8081843.1 alpha-2-glucosyltransferase Alg10 [Gilbertella persicaria]
MSLLAHVFFLITTSVLVNKNAPEPYMDEIFHIPQAQHYCQGDYAVWDPKLTTPPGLYLMSNLIALVGQVFQLDLCTINTLRFTNILFSIGLYVVLVQLVKSGHDWHARLYALALAWFPVGFFYNAVYYTDTGSTFFVLLCYLAVKKRYYHAAGLVGIVSMSFRQTNVIWLCLCMMVAVIDILQDKKQQDHPLYNPLCSDITHPVHMLQSISSLVVHLVHQYRRVIYQTWTFLLGIVLFAVFLVWNSGIVLGDKSNHIAGLHFPQLFYFTSFLSFFSAPWTFSVASIKSLLTLKQCVYGILTGMVSLYLIHNYTYEHPFLLSDNRHYSFYVWKNVYKRHASARYLLAPVYVASGFLNVHVFAQYNSFLFVLGYMITLVLTLVPSPLLEFRYFILPFLFYMIHLPPPVQTYRTLIGLVLYASLHSAAMYLFIYKPFTWPNEPGQIQRFMW